MKSAGHVTFCCKWGALWFVTIAGCLFASTAKAQSSGPNVNECSSGVVDSNTGVEQTVCLYGDQNQLNASAEVDTGSPGPYGEYSDSVGVEGMLFSGGGEDWDSGDACCSSGLEVDYSLVPALNVQYVLESYYDEDQCFGYSSCSFYGLESGLSASAEVTGPPSAPTGLTAAPASGQVALAWTGSTAATSYNVYVGTSSGGENSSPSVTGISGTSDTVTGLANGTTYYFKVAAANSYGSSGMSNEASATPEPLPPSAPSNLVANLGNAQAHLTWAAAAGATSYNVYEGTSPGGEGGNLFATGVGGTSYTATGLTNGETYYFEVSAVNGGGMSGMSNEASTTPQAPPPAPTDLTASAGNAEVQLSWSVVTGADSYNVYEGTASNGESATPIASGLTGTAYLVTGLADGTNYYFKVAAVGPGGTSALSNEATISPSATATDLYSYTLAYDAVGNLTNLNDSVMGNWEMKASNGTSGYDTLNRLIAGRATTCPYNGLQETWNYDAWGNLQQELPTGSLNCPKAPPIAEPVGLHYNQNNQADSVLNGYQGFPPSYDNSGNITCDSYDSGSSTCHGNQYLYDGDGHVCAVSGSSGMMGYLYDAEGRRIAKGTISVWSCDTNPADTSTYNHFSLTAAYILDSNSHQLTELSWNGTAQWVHTNVRVSGQLVATMHGSNVTTFYLVDPVGTRRVQVDSAGTVQCHSLPFGDGADCPLAPTEHLFTQQERDAESGNDYFGARYYASTMGRFLSPDPTQLYYADPSNPQSLNLYSYVYNNPLANIDPTGTDACVYDTGNGTATIYNAADGQGLECPGNGFYITTNQLVSAVGFNSNGDLSVYGANGSLYNSDGSAYDASQSITVSADGGSSYIGPGAISSGSQYLISRLSLSNAPTPSRSADCGAGAMLDGGTSFALDAVGTVPGEGNLAAGIQLGAGVLSATITASDSGANTKDLALAGGGVGLSLADMTGTAESIKLSGKVMNLASKASGGLVPKAIKVVPFVGNAASAYSAHLDWGKMWASYNNCMEHF